MQPGNGPWSVRLSPSPPLASVNDTLPKESHQAPGCHGDVAFDDSMQNHTQTDNVMHTHTHTHTELERETHAHSYYLTIITGWLSEAIGERFSV